MPHPVVEVWRLVYNLLFSVVSCPHDYCLTTVALSQDIPKGWKTVGQCSTTQNKDSNNDNNTS